MEISNFLNIIESILIYNSQNAIQNLKSVQEEKK